MRFGITPVYQLRWRLFGHLTNHRFGPTATMIFFANTQSPVAGRVWVRERPSEHSSGGKQRLGSITKRGNRLMRMLLVEAAQTTVRLEPEFKREYLHLAHRKSKAVAKVAAARKLAVRLYWMQRTDTAYPAMGQSRRSAIPIISSRPPFPPVQHSPSHQSPRHSSSVSSSDNPSSSP
jgi:hypothetical protein